MKKIGILGGTFDPVHNGHLALAKCALREYALQEVWLVPNGAPPHKEYSQIEATGEQRLAMVRLAIENLSGLRVCEDEVRREEISYSYETLERFRKYFPDSIFYFIIGGDSLLAISQWKKPRQLLQACVLLVACRKGCDRDKLKQVSRVLEREYQGQIELLSMPEIDISATRLRKLRKEGKDLREFVPQKVAEYIKEQKLYLEE